MFIVIIIRPIATSSTTAAMVTDREQYGTVLYMERFQLITVLFITAYAITWIVQIQFVHAHETGILPFFLLNVSLETEKPTSVCSSEANSLNSFIRYVVSLTTGPHPLPKRVLHRVRSCVSSFKFKFKFQCLFFYRSLKYLLRFHGHWV